MYSVKDVTAHNEIVSCSVVFKPFESLFNHAIEIMPLKWFVLKKTH